MDITKDTRKRLKLKSLDISKKIAPMPNYTLLKNARIVNEGKDFYGHILIHKEFIEKIFHKDETIPESLAENANTIDLEGNLLMPGVIDDQVHFREPGLTHKGDIHTESLAAAAGGITSFMEMPNTNPQTITQKLLEEKFKTGAEKSITNYSFYIGGTNDNVEELKATDIANVCGVKVFMGSSTGNMLVDNPESLKKIFSALHYIPVAVHCEEESIINKNTELAKSKYGDDIPIEMHPVIRSHDACITSSQKATELAKRHDTRLHLLHLSTAQEMQLLDTAPLTDQKRITAEVCAHHLWFTSDDYKEKQSLIKWNPAVKNIADRDALWEALTDNRLDVIATDHAPHTFEEKQNKYLACPSGAPMVQHSLVLMLESYKAGNISLHALVKKMCHNPAICFNVVKRGFIREGYYADLVVVDMKSEWTVSKENILYKCGWSPLEGQLFTSRIMHTFVNGKQVFYKGKFDLSHRGMALKFNR